MTPKEKQEAIFKAVNFVYDSLGYKKRRDNNYPTLSNYDMQIMEASGKFGVSVKTLKRIIKASKND